MGIAAVSGRPDQRRSDTLPSREPKHPSPQRINALQHASSGTSRNIPPSNSNPNRRARLIQRPTRSLEPEARMPIIATKPFREIQSNAADRPPKLRGQVPIPALHRLNHRARELQRRE